MRKTFLLITISLFSVLLLSLFIGEFFGSNENKTSFGIKSSKYVKTESVFINDLNSFENYTYPSVKITKLFASFWFVDGEYYSVSNTTFSIYDPTIKWKVDLSVLSPVGICGDIVLYSSNGKSDSSVLIAKEQDEFFILVREDVLIPHQYSYEDFTIVEADEEISDVYFEEIWMDHLSGEYNISYMIIEDACRVKSMKMQLKTNPELIYTLNYFEYQGDFYSNLPFEENSNGFYKQG